MNARDLIATLNLQPLPGEGGYFHETYRADDTHAVLPSRYGPGERAFCTAIYYLLTPDTFSALHKLPTDEIFHFYLGSPVEMLLLREDGTGSVITIGPGIGNGMRPQVVVPRGTWQGSRLVDGGEFALLGTTMAPGFEFPDFVAGSRAELTSRYPTYSRWIEGLTREPSFTG